jgi:hypothetical protein
MKNFKEFVNEKSGMSSSDMKKLAKDLAGRAEKGDDIEELVGMALEDMPGAENASGDDIKKIANMVRKEMK